MKKATLLITLAVVFSLIANAESNEFTFWNTLISDDFSTHTDSVDRDIYTLGVYPYSITNIPIENEMLVFDADTANKMLYTILTRPLTDSTLPLRVYSDCKHSLKKDGADAASAAGLYSHTKGSLVGGIYPNNDSTEFRISYHIPDNGSSKEIILASSKIKTVDTVFTIIFSAYPDSLILDITDKHSVFVSTLKTSWSDSLYFPSLSINTQQKDTLSTLYIDNIKVENSITTTSAKATKTNKVKIYPTAASNSITVDGINGGDIIKIHSMTGNIVITQVSNSNKSVIDISSLTNGIYLLSVDSKCYRFIKE